MQSVAQKILIVDDEPDIIEFIGYNLELEGFEILTANNGLEALEKIKQKPSLIILDIMMPKMNGFEVLEKIRSDTNYSSIPVIFLTAKTSEIDEIKGLNFGADDYLKKPISPMTVVARVKNLLRRIKSSDDVKEDIDTAIVFGPIRIESDSYRVFLNNEEIILPKKEFEILTFLVSNPGKVFSRRSLLEKIWDDNIIVTDRTVDVHIRKIREKLAEYSTIIETIKGVGYRVKNVE